MDGYALKLFGCVRMCRLFWPMLKAAQGHVVNIIGGAARTPGADFTIGGSVNAAMGNFSKSLSQLGKRDGVNVNAIHPGATDTERFGELLEQRSKASGKSIDDLRKEATAKDGIRRHRQARGHRRADAVPVLGEGAPHPGHGDRRRWRRDRRLLLSRDERRRASRLRGRLAGQAFALAADPRPLDQATRLDAAYRREEIAPEAFADFIARLAERGYVGANITLPHKEAALAMSEPDDRARAVGAANTLWYDSGRLLSTNTDVEGFTANLDAAVPGWDSAPARRSCSAPAARRAPWSMG